MTTEKKLTIGAWSLSAGVVLLSLFVWLQGMHWRISPHLSLSYQLFPLFGLIAFSVMWSHYIAAAARIKVGVSKHALHTYFETTSAIVLGAILLHPSILWFQLWKDGYGLPPSSYIQHYVAPSLRWAAFLGTFGLLVFLSYELRRKFDSKKWWKYVQYTSDVAMLGIFVHGLKLGKNLYSGWFVYVWYAYGLTLIGALLYLYTMKQRQDRG